MAKLEEKDFHCSRCGLARYGSTTGGEYLRANKETGFVNDGGDRCTDCLESDPEFHVGQLIAVAAWWQNRKPVQCAVVNFNRQTRFMDVEPTSGNRHHRFINAKDVIPEQENYRDQLSGPTMTRPTRDELIAEADELLKHRNLLDSTKELFCDTLQKFKDYLTNPWIPVEERLPDLDEHVLFRRGSHRGYGYRSSISHAWYEVESNTYLGNITHWCPLPPLPKKGDA